MSVLTEMTKEKLSIPMMERKATKDIHFTPDGDIVHIRTLNKVLIMVSPIEAGAEAIGISLASDEFVGRFFSMELC